MDATTGALVIAALSVIVTGVTAVVAPWWARKTERERWDNEREAEATRWARQEGTRRTQRGEDAALELIGVVDKAASQMRSLGKYQQSEFACRLCPKSADALVTCDGGWRLRQDLRGVPA